MRRLLEISDAAIDDLRARGITKREFTALLAEMKRIAAMRFPIADSAVWRLYGTDWLRCKLTEPSQLRVFFSVENEDTTVVIQCVLRRTENTYKIAQILHDVRAA